MCPLLVLFEHPRNAFLLLGWAKDSPQELLVELGVLDGIVQKLGKKLLLELTCVLERLEVKFGKFLSFLHLHRRGRV